MTYNNSLHRRILELSSKHDLSHITSNLQTVGILDDIYSNLTTPDQICVLSMGHAGLALYTILEKHKGQNADNLYKRHGCQPHLDPDSGIFCTTGSLGQGLTVAVGYALANRSRDVHCVISDGECAEGCVWEALAFAHINHLTNLIVHVNVNGYSAMSEVDTAYLERRLLAFLPNIVIHRTEKVIADYPFLQGIHGHYAHVKTTEPPIITGDYI